jgi:hypothetical protein
MDLRSTPGARFDADYDSRTSGSLIIISSLYHHRRYQRHWKSQLVPPVIRFLTDESSNILPTFPCHNSSRTNGPMHAMHVMVFLPFLFSILQVFDLPFFFYFFESFIFIFLFILVPFGLFLSV